ncbi:MAG: hypothetical protein ACE37B_23710 [Ilumatobacter sp.]
MRRMVVVMILVAVAASKYEKLVHVLTRTTGTWVGTPPTRPR